MRCSFRPLRALTFAPLIAGALFVLSLAGCGGGGGGSSSATQNTYTLRPDVVELDKTQAAVTSVTANTVVLAGAPALAPGTIIIHNAPDATRFLRRVVSTSTTGGTTTVTTMNDVTVEDVFATADITQQSPIAAADLLKLQPAQPGVEFLPAASKSRAGRAGDPNAITIKFTGMTLKDDSNNAIAQIDGSISFAAGIETRFSRSYLSIDEFRVAPYANVDGQLTARGRISGSFTKEFPISLNLRIPVTPMGPLGINCDVQLMMKLEGSYSADGQFVLTASVGAKEGVQYTKSGGWSLINQFDKSFNMAPPSARASLEMGVSLVRPKIGADVLGIGEVHVTADVVKAIGKVSGFTSPVPGFLVEGLADFAFTAGGSLKLGPLTLWNQSKDFDLGRFAIIQPITLYSLRPTDSRIVYADLALHALHAMNGDGTGDKVLAVSTTSIYAPNVSNHSGQICFGKFDSKGKGSVWVMNSDGSNQRQITDGSLSINHPCWSPGGDEIAFDASDSKQVKQVYVVNVASKAVRQLTNDNYNSRIPCWSADGSRIYFERATPYNTKVISRTSSSTPTYDVVLANDTTTYAEPSLSPDGLQLLCIKGGSLLIVTDEQGRGERAIFNDSHLSRPLWSPDGTHFVVQYNDVGTVTLQSYDLNGKDGRNLATGMQPSWGLAK
jgi:Tol biopolymer transport system component